MKSVQSPFLVVTAALGLAAYSCAVIGAGQESTSVTSTIAEQVAELELWWYPGIGTQEYEYYVRAGRIARDLFRHEPIAANAVALQLQSNLLAKRADSFEVREADFEVGAADLGAMAEVARYLLAEGNASIGPQHQKIRPFAKLLGIVRAEIVPDYIPKRVVSNVASPAGVPGMAGMDPEAIADPVAREKYKAAIRENQLNNLMNKRQQTLHEMETEFARRIVEYMSRAAAADSASGNIVRQSIIDARLTDTEKAEVMRALQP